MIPTAPRTWLWTLAACLAILLQLPFLAAAFWPPRQFVADYFQDWASARNLSEGLPVYTEHALTIPRYVGEVDPICYRNQVNAHPPTSVLLSAPLARLDYRPALLIWNLSGLLLLGLSLTIVARHLGLRMTAHWVAPALTLLLLCRPLVQQLFLGQLNLILLPLITGAWAAGRSGRRGWAGAMIGAAAAIKLFPAFLFLYPLLKRDWRALLAGAATLAVLTSATLAVMGLDVYTIYFSDVLPRLESFRSSWFNVSLVGFWIRLFNPASVAEHVEPLWRNPIAAQAGILASWLIVVGAIGWSSRNATTRLGNDHVWGATIVGMLLLSPISWDAALLLLLVPIAVLWRNPPRSRPGRELLIAALAAVWFWQKPIIDLIITADSTGRVAQPWHSLTVLAYPCYALVVLFGLLVLGAAGRRVEGVA